ncbi:glycosyltransferase [Gordonia hankookensis]|uniref:Glycosyltransferase family 1 protein n=1 Tax=Gordonia hankookensis TaxID=589403 RepID=A0ABR7WDS3_9ACTN|nr:glycosyltransferase [Gordonia hankookensis]MBD1320548.1 glycosyltransferase family 1 protein [Gordonia hankookensis]
MTTIVILAFGTRGDVAPLTGLATRLRDDLGVRVAIAAQQPYEQLIIDAGLDYRQLPGDTEQSTRDSTYGQAMVDGEKLRPSKQALAGMRDDLAGVGEAMATAAADADLLLCEGPVGSLLGWHVAEVADIPSAALFLQPSTPTGDFAPPALGTRSFGRWGNRTAWTMAAAGEKLFTPLIDDLRATLGLPKQSRRAYQHRRADTWPQLHGISSHVIPRPADWPTHAHLTGYWWPTETADYTPPAALVEFLDDGPPPIYIGLGSTATTHGDRLSHIFADALAKTGHRGIIHRGWANLHGNNAPHIHAIDDVPHNWLLPKTAAAVHHCGAGTTAATLRAAIPSVAIPGIMDQPFWAHRLHQLGVSPPPLRRTTLTADDLAAAITTATTDPAYTDHARSISELLRAENGELAASRIIEQLLADGG